VAGYTFDLNDVLLVEPSFLFKAIENAPSQADLNARFIYKELAWLGMAYRDQESLVILLGFKKGMYAMGYSYDITLTNIKKYSTGSHELFLSVNFPDGKARQSKAIVN